MTVVYAFDFSEAATECAPAAAAIAARLKEPLLVAFVVDPKFSTLAPELEAKLRTSTRARLESLASQLRSSQTGVEVSAVQLQGDTVEGLNAFAQEHAHLLILASAGHRGASPRVDSVSEKVAQRASVPVLVMREPGPWMDWAAGRRSLRAVLGLSRDTTCDGAIELASRIRSAAPCDVIATEVYFAPEMATHYGLGSPPRWLKRDPDLEKLMERDLSKRTAALRGSGEIRNHLDLGVDRPADNLLDLAERERADVVITGRHSPLRPDSVSATLLHESRMSILVVPNPVRAGRFGGFPRVQRILAATDLTGFGNQAVRAAAALALATEGELRLLHVAETQVPTWDEEASTVAKLRQLLPERWPLPVSTEVVFGRDPATAIAAAGERIDADTICVASHARGGLARVALGSVTEDLLQKTHRPVLVVRPVQE
jgi:nucleotide-binding universal stress UspA family protein